MPPIDQVSFDDKYDRGGAEYGRRLRETLADHEDAVLVLGARGSRSLERELNDVAEGRDIATDVALGWGLGEMASDPDHLRRQAEEGAAGPISDEWVATVGEMGEQIDRVVTPELAADSVPYHLVANELEAEWRRSDDLSGPDLQRLVVAETVARSRQDAQIAEHLDESIDRGEFDEDQVVLTPGRSQTVGRRLVARGRSVAERNQLDADPSESLEPPGDGMPVRDWLAMTADIKADGLEDDAVDGEVLDLSPDAVPRGVRRLRDEAAAVVRGGYYTDLSDSFDPEEPPTRDEWDSMVEEFRAERSPLDRLTDFAGRVRDGLDDVRGRLRGPSTAGERGDTPGRVGDAENPDLRPLDEDEHIADAPDDDREPASDPRARDRGTDDHGGEEP